LLLLSRCLLLLGRDAESEGELEIEIRSGRISVELLMDRPSLAFHECFPAKKEREKLKKVGFFDSSDWIKDWTGTGWKARSPTDRAPPPMTDSEWREKIRVMLSTRGRPTPPIVYHLVLLSASAAVAAFYGYIHLHLLPERNIERTMKQLNREFRSLEEDLWEVKRRENMIEKVVAELELAATTKRLDFENQYQREAMMGAPNQNEKEQTKGREEIRSWRQWLQWPFSRK
jgi:hypothetical protein